MPHPLQNADLVQRAAERAGLYKQVEVVAAKLANQDYHDDAATWQTLIARTGSRATECHVSGDTQGYRLNLLSQAAKIMLALEDFDAEQTMATLMQAGASLQASYGQRAPDDPLAPIVLTAEP